MTRSDARVPMRRGRSLGKIAATIGVAAIIGFTAVSPANAYYDDWRTYWRDREWREHQRPYGYGYSYPYYGYSYPYSYPYYGYSYPSYGYYYPGGSSDYGAYAR
jgi:hypothetical protein